MSNVSLIDGHIDEPKFTEEDIIKALECCINEDCNNCPYTFGNCGHNAMRNTLDLINRQKAEIERLTDSNNRLKEAVGQLLNNDNGVELIKSEAIKEFAEKLKEEAVTRLYYGKCFKLGYHECVEVEVIDNLIKEMTEVETNQRKENEGKCIMKE